MSEQAPKELRRQTRQVDDRVDSMTNAIQRWMLRHARIAAREESDRLIGKVSKADPGSVEELVALIMRYGLAQTREAALGIVSSTVGLDQIIDTKALARDIKQKTSGNIVVFQTVSRKIKEWAEVQADLVMGETRDGIRKSVNDLISSSLEEIPRPSTGEIARRIRTQFHGPAGTRMFAFSPERAALIARTEMVQAENTGTHEGYKLAGVKVKRWLSYRDGKSGSRHHELMHNVTIPIDEMFELPSGKRLMFPGDPSGDISETANCRCGTRAVIIPDTRGKSSWRD